MNASSPNRSDAEVDRFPVDRGRRAFLCEMVPVLQPRIRRRRQSLDRQFDSDGHGSSAASPVVGRRVRTTRWHTAKRSGRRWCSASCSAPASRRFFRSIGWRGCWVETGFGSVAAAGVLSIPSMMCTCCAAPVVVGLRERQASPGAAIAFWLGNTVLNPATLVFMGFVLGWNWTALRSCSES